jgi:hypothetical protein
MAVLSCCTLKHSSHQSGQCAVMHAPQSQPPEHTSGQWAQVPRTPSLTSSLGDEGHSFEESGSGSGSKQQRLAAKNFSKGQVCRLDPPLEFRD